MPRALTGPQIFFLADITCCSYEEFREWLEANRQTHERPSKYVFCSDCTEEYAQQKKAEGTCNGYHHLEASRAKRGMQSQSDPPSA